MINIRGLQGCADFDNKLLKWLPGWHFLFSMVVACLITVLITVFWFPPPYHLLGGGLQLFWIMLGVDMVCGPLLTWILIRPGKSWIALIVDFVIIACLQLGALAYGVHALAVARPLAVVFEVDRFRVISYSDVPEEEVKNSTVPAWFTPWSFQAPKTMGLRSVRSLSEKIASVDAAFQGVDAAQRPSRWQDYSMSKEDILSRARPLDDLRTRYPAESDVINATAGSAGISSNGLWLPLVGRRSAEWVALIDPTTAAIVGYLPLDGFF